MANNAINADNKKQSPSLLRFLSPVMVNFKVNTSPVCVDWNYVECAAGQGIAAYAGEGAAAKTQATAEHYPLPVQYGNFHQHPQAPPGTSSERRSSDSIYD